MEADVEEGGDHANVKKNLNFDVVNPSDATETTSSDSDLGVVPPPPPAYMDPRDRAKQRKTSFTNDLATSASSGAEDRRAQ
jgi:hypothetical protein